MDDIPEISLGGPSSEDQHQQQEQAQGQDTTYTYDGRLDESGAEALQQDADEQQQQQQQQDQQQQQQQQEEQPEVYTGNEVEEEEMAEITMSNKEVMGAYRDLTAIPGYVAERYGSIATRLDLSYNCLTNVSSLERFTQLRELVLDNNDITDGITFPSMPSLHSLSLNKCQIKELDRFLTMLRERLPNLTFLSLIGNEACPNGLMGGKSEEDYNRYRLRVLYILPSLKFLDSRGVTQAEVTEAKRVGEFAKVVRVSERDMEEQAAKRASVTEEKQLFSPLPKDVRSPDAHKGTIGTCKYVYYGRHSEGNRFIRNNDL